MTLFESIVSASLNEGKFNQFMDIEVSSKDNVAKDGKILTFWGIKSMNEINAILDRLLLPNGVGMMRPANPEKNITKAFSKGNSLIVIVKNDKIDAFLDTGLKSIQAVLLKSGKYNNDAILQLTDEVASKLTEPSKEEKEKMFADAKVSEIDMWTDYLNKINDPDTREILQLYSEIYGNTSYGHLLSLKNVMTIRSIDPNATFVLGKSTWAKFGRGVKRGAKGFPLWGASYNKDATIDDINAALKNMGHEGVSVSDLGVAVQQEVEIIAGNLDAQKNKKGGIIPFRYIGYDIADTYLYANASYKDDQGNEIKGDPLMGKPNIISNVTVKLNQLAQAAEDKKNAERGGEIKGRDEMLEKTQMALEAVKNACAEKGMDVENVRGETPSQFLITLLKEYYMKMMQSNKNIVNVIREGNMETVADDAVQLTLLMNGIALDQLNHFRHSYVYSQKEGAALSGLIRNMTMTIGKSIAAKLYGDGKNNNAPQTQPAAQPAYALSESIDEEFRGDDDYHQEFLQACKELGIRIEGQTDAMVAESSVKESFFNMLNRMNDIF